jgi:hypothetical protein
MPLTDTGIRALKPTDKVQRFSDANGMCLEISPAGCKAGTIRYSEVFRSRPLIRAVAEGCAPFTPADQRPCVPDAAGMYLEISPVGTSAVSCMPY